MLSRSNEAPQLGKPMKEWLRFSVCYWHTWRGTGSDMFGEVRAAIDSLQLLLI